MKKSICSVIFSISILFLLIGAFLYVYSLNNYVNETFFGVLEFVNGAFILISAIVSFVYIEISVNEWFSDDDNDMMSIKDRVILAITICMAVTCGVLFIGTIIYNNATAQAVSKIDNMRLTTLILSMFNTFVAYAYYQNYQVLKNNTK
ncbi:MAG: hypothetical protein IKA02_03240 [Clostridia bacterium]|nr:hypothetical protein [Clostridia bacterium]